MPESRVRLPPGMTMVPDGMGGYEVVRQQEHLVHTVAWRMTEEDYDSILVFVEAFPEHTFAAAMRWLLKHPAVQEVMLEKISQAHSR